jgi:hypothetical protein
MTAATIDKPGTPAHPAGWPGAVLGLAAGALLCWGVITQPQRGWTPPAQVPVQLGEQHYRLDTARLEWIEAFSRRHFSTGQADGAPSWKLSLTMDFAAHSTKLAAVCPNLPTGTIPWAASTAAWR